MVLVQTLYETRQGRDRGRGSAASKGHARAEAGTAEEAANKMKGIKEYIGGF